MISSPPEFALEFSVHLIATGHTVQQIIYGKDCRRNLFSPPPYPPKRKMTFNVIATGDTVQQVRYGKDCRWNLLHPPPLLNNNFERKLLASVDIFGLIPPSPNFNVGCLIVQFCLSLGHQASTLKFGEGGADKRNMSDERYFRRHR